MNKKGFTLTEILATIALISIISLIAIPSITKISESIRERAYNSKINSLVAAAELFAQDNPSIFETESTVTDCTNQNPNETCIYVKTLLEENYIEKDSDCEETIGCVINPKNNESMNNDWVLVKRKKTGTVGIWKEKTSIIQPGDTICDKLDIVNGEFIGNDGEKRCDCTDLIEDGDVCLITGNNVNNYLRYPNGSGSDKMWRIIGVYRINGENVLKIITDDNIVLNE